MAVRKPAGHFWHVLPGEGEKDPAAHCVQTEEPARLDHPAWQRRHSARPVPCWKRPALQSEQTLEPGSEAIEPAGH